MHRVYSVKFYIPAKGQPQSISKLSSCQQKQENVDRYTAESIHELRTNQLFWRSNVLCSTRKILLGASKKETLYHVTSTDLDSFIHSSIL